MRLIDLTGQRFGRLIVLQRETSLDKRTYWLCRCDCGNHHTVNGTVLKSGKTSSCGCYRVEVGRKHGATISLTHGACRGGKSTPEYAIWTQMWNRCTNPNWVGFARYGGRGVSVCEEWKSFETFLADMGPRPPGRHGNRPLYSIDRRDNKGDYTPENCHWATWKQQNRNTRGNHVLEIMGKKKTIAEWSELLEVPRDKLRKISIEIRKHR